MSGTQLRNAKQAATQLGLEASLTPADWKHTCTDLDHRCAYCGITVTAGGSLDHFQPLDLQGGTTITNCILSCRSCNTCKANMSPEVFLADRPERLARLRHYLAHRRPGQPRLPFWTFPMPEEKDDFPMNKETMQSTPLPLSSGAKLFLYNDEQQTVLQFHLPSSDTDPLTPGIQAGVLITGPECLKLAWTLLGYGSEKVTEKVLPAQTEEYSSSPPYHPWNQ